MGFVASDDHDERRCQVFSKSFCVLGSRQENCNGGPLPGLALHREWVSGVSKTRTLLSDHFLEDAGSSRAELRIKASSEVTWMKAASKGLRNPNAAKPTPTPSTIKVPAELAIIILRHRCAIFKVSTNL